MDQHLIKIKLQEVRHTMEQLCNNLDILFDEAFRHQTHEAPPSPPTPKKKRATKTVAKKEIILEKTVAPRTEVSSEGVEAEVLE
jgi:hypothetical protein